MIFYRFKGNDDLWLGKYGKNQNTLIPNELKTEKEIENIKATSPRLSIDKAFERIDIPKSDTYTSFGVRFQYGYDHNGKTESIKRSATKVMINEAESYGWVVEDYQAQEAYEFACDYFGEDELNAQIVGTLSNEELASSLAFLFRMNDFREWEEINESVNTTGSSKDIVTMFNNDTELYNKLIDVIDIYNATSVPVSGDWDTETEHEQKTIADTFNISLEDAKRVMIDILGFDEDLF